MAKKNGNIKDQYRVKTTKEAEGIAKDLLKEYELENVLFFGLPEVDDRYHIWRVPLITDLKKCLGEVVIDARFSFVDDQNIG